MWSWYWGLLLVPGCNNPKKPNSGNFTRAVNAYLAVHGKACVSTPWQFPVDIPKSRISWDRQEIADLSAFESAGLLKSGDTTAVVRGMFEVDGKVQPVRRYDLTDSGKKYLQQQMGLMGSTAAFCYAQEAVNSIVKWNEPATQGGFSETVVTYTYRLSNLADWAQNQELLSQYPQMKQELDGEKVQERPIGLQLTNKGWDTN